MHVLGEGAITAIWRRVRRTMRADSWSSLALWSDLTAPRFYLTKPWRWTAPIPGPNIPSGIWVESCPGKLDPSVAMEV